MHVDGKVVRGTPVKTWVYGILSMGRSSKSRGIDALKMLRVKFREVFCADRYLPWLREERWVNGQWPRRTSHVASYQRTLK